MKKNELPHNKIEYGWMFLFVLLTVYCQHIQLTYSASTGIRYCLFMHIGIQILNILAAAVPFLLSYLIVGNAVLAMGISDIIVTLLSLINYHVFLFHGTPFLAADFYNIGTAMGVLPSYHIVIDTMVLRLLLIFGSELGILILFCITRVNDRRPGGRRRIFILLSLDLIVLWFSFFSRWTIFPASLVSWSWSEPMRKYGYEVCFLNGIHTISNKYNMIDGYDAKLLEAYVDDAKAGSTPTENGSMKYPDIIVILNESLCDLNYCAGISEGASSLETIKNIEGMVSGYTTVPLIGGGTNCSEYELLTSNSMYEISSASPFYTLDLSGANSIVSYLKALGYSSTAMHCYSDTNYARNTAYPALGFDHVYLGSEYYTYNRNGNREWLDADNYRDMLSWYRESEGPQFMYLLTFQNHGGYEQNLPEMDTVTIKEDLGKEKDDVNEYLTSLSLSAAAFEELILELSESDRPVIVLMVGDHAPSFIINLPSEGEKTEVSIKQRSVPFFLWSNMEMDINDLKGTSTLTDLMPMLLKSAGMPLSPYYKLINDLHLRVPIRTSDGIYIDQNGNQVIQSDSGEVQKTIQHYYYMEYNNLRRGEDYIQGLFIP